MKEDWMELAHIRDREDPLESFRERFELPAGQRDTPLHISAATR